MLHNKNTPVLCLKCMFANESIDSQRESWLAQTASVTLAEDATASIATSTRLVPDSGTNSFNDVRVRTFLLCYFLHETRLNVILLKMMLSRSFVTISPVLIIPFEKFLIETVL